MRYPAVAGRFYPDDPKSLHSQIEDCFKHSLGPGIPEVGSSRDVVAVLSPHAGYMASGMNAAHAYHRIASSGLPDVYVIIGPDHQGIPYSVALSDEDYLTPFGPCEVDKELVETLSKKIPNSPKSHLLEHSIEVQLPFIQYIDDNPKIVPIIMGDQSLKTAKKLGAILSEALVGRNAIVIASSDMSHYVPKDVAKTQDMDVLDCISTLNPEIMYDCISKSGASICGFGPIAATMYATNPDSAELLCYSDSWDSLEYDLNSVVGYASMAFVKK